jgi:hypothetical protein
MFKMPTLALITVAGLMVSPPEPSRAAILNGSFETGNFTGWDITGQTRVETSAFGKSDKDAK